MTNDLLETLTASAQSAWKNWAPAIHECTVYVLDRPELTDDEEEELRRQLAADPSKELPVRIRIELGGVSITAAYVSLALYRRLRFVQPGRVLQASVLVLPAQNITIVF